MKLFVNGFMNGHSIARGVGFWVLMLVAGSAIAAPAYVTDKLRLGVHAAADTSDRPFTNVSSGDRVEIPALRRQPAIYVHQRQSLRADRQRSFFHQ